MEAGSRVVRGPDWTLDSESDGGEGFVGTVVEVGGKSSTLPENLVWVQWDSGIRHDHRAGYYGAYDLYVLDIAPIGAMHPEVKCSVCQQKPILGMRWHCIDCKRSCDLCTTCYMRDEHEKSHRFLRIDDVHAKGVNVGVRHSTAKVQSKGIFPGSKVMRGPHWEWDNHDGGKGNEGVVKKITDWQGTPASAAVVSWDCADKGTYRLGYQGKVDLRCTTSAVGGFYYKSHLPRLGDKLIKKDRNDSGQNRNECFSHCEDRANDELTDDDDDNAERNCAKSESSEEDFLNDQLTDDEENDFDKAKEESLNDQLAEDDYEPETSMNELLAGDKENDEWSSGEESLSDEGEYVNQRSEDVDNDQLTDDEETSFGRVDVDQGTGDIAHGQPNFIEDYEGNTDQISEDVDNDQLTDDEQNSAEKENTKQSAEVENDQFANNEKDSAVRGHMCEPSILKNDQVTSDEENMLENENLDQVSDGMENDPFLDDEPDNSNQIEEGHKILESNFQNREFTDYDSGTNQSIDADGVVTDVNKLSGFQGADSAQITGTNGECGVPFRVKQIQGSPSLDTEKFSNITQHSSNSEGTSVTDSLTGNSSTVDTTSSLPAVENNLPKSRMGNEETKRNARTEAGNTQQPVNTSPWSRQKTTDAAHKASLGVNKLKASRSGLHRAAITGQWKTVELLLENGEDVDRRDKFDLTPLHLAAWYGQESVVKALLKHNADVNAVDRFQKTPLHKAQRNNHMSIVQLLKEKSFGTNADIPSLRCMCKTGLVRTDRWSGLNLIQAAAYEGNYDIIVKAIVSLDDPIREMNVESAMNNAKVAPGKTAYDILSDLHTPNHRKLKALFEETFEKVATLSELHNCAKTDDVEKVVELVVENEQDVNAPAMGNRTPLLWASPTSCSDFIDCMMALGADANALREDNVTPLFLAVDWNNYMTVSALARNKADLNFQDGNGNTSLHVSVKRGSFHLAQLLIRLGCNVNIQNHKGESALHIAVERGDQDITKLLLEGGAHPNIHKMQTFEDRLFLVGGDGQSGEAWHYVLVNKPLLGLFSKKLDEGIVELEDYGIVLESGSGDGPSRSKTEEITRQVCTSIEGTLDVTPLHSAAVNNDLRVIGLLLQHGADVDAVDADGYTALHVAAVRGKREVVEKLVRLNADINKVTIDGRDALDLAVQNEEAEIEAFLKCL